MTPTKDIPGYLVWCPTSGYPTTSHRFFEDAQAEAGRLSRENPGARFHVMASLGWFEEPVRTTWNAIDPMSHEIPF